MWHTVFAMQVNPLCQNHAHLLAVCSVYCVYTMCVYVYIAVYIVCSMCIVFAMQVNPLCQNHANLLALNTTASRCIKETMVLEQIQAAKNG